MSGKEGCYAFPMRNSFVSHTGHVPCVAGLLFLRVTAVGFFISRFVRHFMQYASTRASFRLKLDTSYLTEADLAMGDRGKIDRTETFRGSAQGAPWQRQGSNL